MIHPDVPQTRYVRKTLGLKKVRHLDSGRLDYKDPVQPVRWGISYPLLSCTGVGPYRCNESESKVSRFDYYHKVVLPSLNTSIKDTRNLPLCLDHSRLVREKSATSDNEYTVTVR